MSAAERTLHTSELEHWLGGHIAGYKMKYKYLWVFLLVCVILGALAKLRKATVGFVMSVRPHGTPRLPLDGFSWILTFGYFSKICRENYSLIKIR